MELFTSSSWVVCHVYTSRYVTCLTVLAGNALGMMGVSAGVAATLGLLQPPTAVITQMAATMGLGKTYLY